MKIELVKQTTALSGIIYYYVNVDGSFQSETFTRDLEEAKKHLKEVSERAIMFPVTLKETLETVEL